MKINSPQFNLMYKACMKASKTLVYKWFNITTSFKGENFNGQPIMIGKIMTNESKYFFDVNLAIK